MKTLAFYCGFIYWYLLVICVYIKYDDL